MPDRNILIMAGGTGGHVYPALAVAACLKNEGFRLYWLGTDAGLESRVVPAHGYTLFKINVFGVRGQGMMKLLCAPLMLILASLQSVHVMLRIRPVVVLGMGGFVSGPGGIAAWLLGRPLIIHEQNAVLGLTNRLLAPFASKRLAAFPGVFKKSNQSSVTGNPVRADIIQIPPPEERLNTKAHRPIKICVLGGSQGATYLNRIVPDALADFADECPFEVIHQCGARHLEKTHAYYVALSCKVELVAFIEDMAAVYRWADLVICRAGALTIAEVAACGIASILVPFPYAVDDHQTVNASYLVDNGAAILLQEKELSSEKLKGALVSLGRTRHRLLDMAVAARALAKPDATESVVRYCIEASHV